MTQLGKRSIETKKTSIEKPYWRRAFKKDGYVHSGRHWKNWGSLCCRIATQIQSIEEAVRQFRAREIAVELGRFVGYEKNRDESSILKVEPEPSRFLWGREVIERGSVVVDAIDEGLSDLVKAVVAVAGVASRESERLPSAIRMRGEDCGRVFVISLSPYASSREEPPELATKNRLRSTRNR
ncbi:unnamed protein product [Linum tenue]|uniref:Uncharacterized protein n=1 Tax=Linum tenue TaxID=586396 RepID=A0AAV0HB57_9ROSI|nr:unnamed protein product [Linum tenue]